MSTIDSQNRFSNPLIMIEDSQEDDSYQTKKGQVAAGSNDNLRTMIQKIYEEQNSEKIKIAN